MVAGGDLKEGSRQSGGYLLCIFVVLPFQIMLVPVILKEVLGSGNYNPHVYKWNSKIG